MELQELLQRALSEIKGLRASNECMRLRLDMFDDLMSALHGKPGTNHPSGGMAPDVAYELQKKLKEMEPGNQKSLG